VDAPVRLRAIRVILMTLTSLVLITACDPADTGKSAAMSLDREVFLPRVGGSARALLPRADGAVLVAGGSGTAWAVALDNKASQLWRYDEPADPAVKFPNQSIYNGAVSLANGNLLLCGEVVTKAGGQGLITLLDPAGKVVEERRLVANNAREFFFSTLQQCFPWNGGILLMGLATNQSGTLTWLVTLDAAGAQTAQRLSAQLPATQVVATSDGGLLFADHSGGDQQTQLTRVNRQLEIVGHRAIKSSAFALLRSSGPTAGTKFIAYESGSKSLLYTLDEKLEDLKSPQTLGGVSIDKGCGYILADGSLALFGYVYKGGPYTAAMARIDPEANTVATHTFTPELTSFTVADARPLSGGRFVAVRDRAARTPSDESGIVVFWLTLK
jgi:hypothetical protein